MMTNVLIGLGDDRERPPLLMGQSWRIHGRLYRQSGGFKLFVVGRLPLRILSCRERSLRPHGSTGRHRRRTHRRRTEPGRSIGPRGAPPSGWRNVPSGFQHKVFRDADDVEHAVSYRHSRAGLQLPDDPGVALISADPGRVVLTDGGVETTFLVARYGYQVHVNSARGAVTLTAAPRFPEPGSAVAQRSLLAPMPGEVGAVVARVKPADGP